MVKKSIHNRSMLDFCITIYFYYIFLIYFSTVIKSKRFFIFIKKKKCYHFLANKNILYEICIKNKKYNKITPK